MLQCAGTATWGGLPWNMYVKGTPMRYTIASFSFLLFMFQCSHAQLTINASLQSRYIWRGIECGDSPTFFPALSYTNGNLSAGVVGTYGFWGGAGTYTENDFWCEYRIPLNSGTIALQCTDLYFPYLGKKFFNFNDHGNGAHTVEVGLQFNGPSSFPLIGRIYRNIYNDPDFSSYSEVEYQWDTNSILMSSTLGVVLSRSMVYGTEKPSLFFLSLKATRSISLLNQETILLSASWIVNLYHERSYIIVSLGL